MLSVNRSVVDRFPCHDPVRGLTVRRHDSGARRDSLVGQGRQHLVAVNGNWLSSSTQNDWKFDLPQAGSCTVRSPGTSASIVW